MTLLETPASRAAGRSQEASRERGRSLSQKRSLHVNGVLFTLPAIAILFLVVVVPLVQAIYYSFTNWNGNTADFVGVRNYASVFIDADLQRTLVNSLCLVASIPVGMVLPFVTAYLLSSVPGSKLLRSIIFAPTALSWVVIGLVARSFFATEGPINAGLDLVGLEGLALNWLANPTAALVAVLITFNLSIFGVNTIIFLTGLSTLDKSMIEAARVDGASGSRILFSIVLPAMRRFVEFVFIITVVLSFTGLFGLIYVMTAGGPGSATTTLEFAVWKRAFASGDFGLAAALGLVLMVLILISIGAARLFSRLRGGDE